jgi:IS5 family transposase|tara:strand:+ start:7377 stop:8579 length:1203 start_codon:yes stop_codon:yes gene_type:complete
MLLGQGFRLLVIVIKFFCKRQATQRDLLVTYLEDILNTRHELVQMGKRIDWTGCEHHFGQLYAVESGRPGLPIRLHVGLQLLKHIFALSDRDVLDRWVENPYWQHFCGEVIFQHRLPINETTMMRFRHRIGEDGARELLKMSVALGQDAGVIAPESLKVAVIDTTVMPKAIAYPSGARLAGRCHRQLVDLAKDEGIKFRQTFCKGLPGMVWQVGRYAHARQFKRMHRVLRQMHRNLARVCEAIIDQRTIEQRSERLNHKLYQALRLLSQYGDRSVKPRLYSLHEPDVVCIATGKARTRYEFGSKVSVVTTAKEGFVLHCRALAGNPYDGHTVDAALKRVLLHTSKMPEHLLADRGYRGSESTYLSKIHITGKRQGRGKDAARPILINNTDETVSSRSSGT